MENLKIEIEKIEKAIKNTNKKREYIRLKAVELKLKGFSAKEVSQKLEVGISTVFGWLKAYRENSVKGLKNKKRKKTARNLTYEEEKQLLTEFWDKANKGQVVTAKDIEKEYIKRVGHRIGGSQIYRVLKRHGCRKVMPRSKHPKKTSEEVIEASKKLTQ